MKPNTSGDLPLKRGKDYAQVTTSRELWRSSKETGDFHESNLEVIMAWDHYEIGGLELVSGDTMFDELRGAVRRIRREYLERFGRNPYLGELLYTLCRIVENATPSVVEDPTPPLIENILSSLTVPTPSDLIDPGNYEAGFNDYGEVEIGPGVGALGTTRSGAPVLRLRIDDHRPQEVVCRYTLLSLEVSDTTARCLIRYCALSGLLRYDTLDPKLVVRFEKQ